VFVASGNAASAAGTNIAVSAVSALVGGIEHARAGRVDWRIVAWMAPPSVAAAFVGGVVSGVVPNGVLLGLIAAVLVHRGSTCSSGSRLRPTDPASRARWRPSRAPGSAFCGRGGRAHPRDAAAAGAPRGDRHERAPGGRHESRRGLLPGRLRLRGPSRAREVEWAVLGVSVAAAIPGSILGARLTGRLSERALRRAIGVALLVVRAAIAVAAVR
jgi:uncharacterized membrane protein YfcA